MEDSKFKDLYDTLTYKGINIDEDVRYGNYNGNEGYYFRKKDKKYFSLEEENTIEKIFMENENFELIAIDSPDEDGDRYWPASIQFMDKNNF